MLDIVKKLFELGFKRDFVSELAELIKHADVLSGQNLVEMLSQAIIPIALSLVSLFWVLELMDKTLKYQESGMSWEHILMLAVKLFFAVSIVKTSPIIMEVIVSTADSILANIGVSAEKIQELQFNQLWQEIESLGMVKQIMMTVQLIPMGLIAMLVAVIVRVVIYARAIKLIILSAFSPLPMSTLVFDNQRDIGKRFIQNFFSACLQGAVIILILILSNKLHQISILDTSDIGGNISDIKEIPSIFVRYLFINCTLLVALIKSESWASKIIGL